MNVISFWSANAGILTSAFALAAITVAIFLIARSIGEKARPHTADSSAGVDIDAIEGALRKALAQTPVFVAGAASSGGVDGAAAFAGTAEGSEAVARSAQAVAEATQRAETLQKELEQTQLELAARVAEADSKGGVTPGATSGGDEALAARLKELEARLAEYEIIEDDIADLSHFKEENMRLRDEIEGLRVAVSAASTAAPAAGLVSSEGQVDLKFKPADSFELSADDEIMKEFAAAVNETPSPAPSGAEASAELARVAAELAQDNDLERQAAEAATAAPAAAPAEVSNPQDAIDAALANAFASIEPVASAPVPAPEPAAPAVASQAEAGHADADKILGEVASLDSATVTDDSGLDQALDPEKLMQEAAAMDDVTAEDDILSEFRDETKGESA